MVISVDIHGIYGDHNFSVVFISYTKGIFGPS